MNIAACLFFQVYFAINKVYGSKKITDQLYFDADKFMAGHLFPSGE